MLAVKLWAKNHGINEAKFQTLSSYALTVMMIHYLQYAVKPQVDPLQLRHDDPLPPVYC